MQIRYLAKSLFHGTFTQLTFVVKSGSNFMVEFEEIKHTHHLSGVIRQRFYMHSSKSNSSAAQ